MSALRSVGLVVAVGALGGAAEAATVQHWEPLRSYREGGSHKPTPGAPTTLSFNAFSRDFALELEPNGRLAAAAARSGQAAAAYRGKIAGQPDSWVRLVLTAAGPSGLVFDGTTLFGIEAGGDTALAPGAPAMYRLADLYLEPGELGCGSAAAAIDGEQAVVALAREVAALAADGATLNLDLGAVADFEFSQAFGANAEAELLTRLNNVDGIFSEQLGVQISVADVDIFTAADDPFTTTVAATLLDELADYRGATPSQNALGLTHLFTGRNLDGTTVGIAYFGAVCAQRGPFDSRSFGAGLSESRRGAVIDSLVAAHEIGHNFGAPHDGDADEDCASVPPTFLMSPSISGSNRFSQCSIDEMQAEIATATCLTPIGPADMSVTLPPVPPVFAGATFTQGATVRNSGADEATSVVFTAAAATGLSIVGANAGGASCTVAPSSASCALGSVGGGASRNITLSLLAQSPGTFDLTAEVAAAVDPDSSDNRAVKTVTAVPAVDLVWSGGAASVQLNAQASVVTTLTNAADFTATGVTVTAAVAAGARPDQAALGGVACAIAGQSMTCPAQSLPARGSVPLTLMLTGTATGLVQLTVGAAAAEAERNPGDNELTRSITVTAPPSPGGGGGALSVWAVAALLLAARLRRRQVPGRRRPS